MMRFFIILPFLIQGCASMEGNIGIGAGAGAAAGLGTGYALHYNTKGKIFTTATGAVVGAGVGFLMHKLFAKSDSSNVTTAEKERLEKYPFLSGPEVSKICKDDEIQGNKFVEKHCIFVIDRNSFWLKKE